MRWTLAAARADVVSRLGERGACPLPAPEGFVSRGHSARPSSISSRRATQKVPRVHHDGGTRPVTTSDATVPFQARFRLRSRPPWDSVGFPRDSSETQD